MKAKRAIVIVVSLIFVAAVVLFGFSWSSRAAAQPDGVVTPIVGKPKVVFASGSFPVDAEEISVVLAPGESELLNNFPALKSVDLSGSECYEEFLAWAEEHPDVSLRYSVALPDGSTVDNSAESLDLSSFDAQGVSAVLENCKYLPKLKSIDLGRLDAERAIAPEAMTALREANPELSFKYSCTIAGKTVDNSTESLDLSGLSRDDALLAAQLLPGMSSLKSVHLGYEGDGGVSWDDIAMLQDACPDISFGYLFTRFGQELNINSETLNFSHTTMNDEGAEVRSFLPYMKNCTYLDMDFCNVSNEAMDSIRQDYPNIKVVWRIWFADEYSVRTDVERILASKPSVGGTIGDKEAAVFKYCSDLKYLDLGHNEAVTDLSFVYGMPNLEVLNVAMNPVVDLTPLASCTHLEYLDLHSTKVADLSPLAGLTELRHLNIGNTNVTDISPIYGLTDLERFWIGSNTPVPAEQAEQMRQSAPNCEVNNETYDPEGGRWRVTGYTELSLALYEETGWLQEVLHPRYELLREQFGFTDNDYAFSWNDPLY